MTSDRRVKREKSGCHACAQEEAKCVHRVRGKEGLGQYTLPHLYKLHVGSKKLQSTEEAGLRQDMAYTQYNCMHELIHAQSCSFEKGSATKSYTPNRIPRCITGCS